MKIKTNLKLKDIHNEESVNWQYQSKARKCLWGDKECNNSCYNCSDFTPIDEDEIDEETANQDKQKYIKAWADYIEGWN